MEEGNGKTKEQMLKDKEDLLREKTARFNANPEKFIELDDVFMAVVKLDNKPRIVLGGAGLNLDELHMVRSRVDSGFIEMINRVNLDIMKKKSQEKRIHMPWKKQHRQAFRG